MKVNPDYTILTLEDSNYPARLKNIIDLPGKLYVKGSNFSLFDRPAIAVVGSRKSSEYGKQVVKKIVPQLTEKGFVIISGLARGTDTIVHQTVLESGGQTIAVLGSGIDIVYPPENYELYQNIQLVISELPPGTKPLSKNFLPRNRIIAGLSDAVLVIEAARRSGTLATAARAADQGKEVFAIPGPITSPLSEGTAWLIKQGAKIVFDVNDILEEL